MVFGDVVRSFFFVIQYLPLQFFLSVFVIELILSHFTRLDKFIYTPFRGSA